MSASCSRSYRPVRFAVIIAGACIALAIPTASFAQDAAIPCSSIEYRQFDFWLGDWEITNPAGDVVGTNTITAVSGGCGLHERWEGAGGGVGVSLNAYDRRTGSWHQTWVGGAGLLLRLEGGLRNESMVLEGTLSEGDKVVRQRITWTPDPDGSVRQLWESSEDDGASWNTAFDGTYRSVNSR